MRERALYDDARQSGHCGDLMSGALDLVGAVSGEAYAVHSRVEFDVNAQRFSRGGDAH